MKKCNRILKNSDFKDIIKNGKKVNGSLFSIFFINNKLHDHRIGISVSKKVSKLAVNRNLIKRRIVATISKEKLSNNLNKDVVIIAKPLIINKTYNEIKDELILLFNKIKRKEKENV